MLLAGGLPASQPCVQSLGFSGHSQGFRLAVKKLITNLLLNTGIPSCYGVEPVVLAFGGWSMFIPSSVLPILA